MGCLICVFRFAVYFGCGWRDLVINCCGMYCALVLFGGFCGCVVSCLGLCLSFCYFWF